MSRCAASVYGVDENSRPVGIVTTTDILAAVAAMKNALEEAVL